MESWSNEDWQYFWNRDDDNGAIPVTTLASLYDQDAGSDNDRQALAEADMFISAVVNVLDAMFLFDAGIAEWSDQ